MSKTNETVDHPKTVKGWAHQNSATGAYVFSAAQFSLVDGVPATLVFSHNRLYTEAEVVAMLEAERLRVEALVEAGEELRRFLRKPIALSDEGVRHVHEQWDQALDKYRKNR